jgi:hypothetical protein
MITKYYQQHIERFLAHALGYEIHEDALNGTSDNNNDSHAHRHDETNNNMSPNKPVSAGSSTSTNSTAMNPMDPAKAMIILDFYYYGLLFARECHFSADQCAVFFQLMKSTHEHCMSTAVILLEKDYEHFKNVLLNKGLYRPPNSDQVFDFHQLKLIHDYMLNTYVAIHV